MPQHRAITARELILLGYSVAVVAIALFYFTFASSTKELRQVSENLFHHPFTVHSAAADIKASLHQIRGETLLMVVLRMRPDDWDASTAKIRKLETQTHENLTLLRRSFLGDMSRVDSLEKNFDEWSAVRNSIVDAMLRGDTAVAEQMIKTEGAPRFNAVLIDVDYVLSFSQNKATQFVGDASEISNNVLGRGQIVAAILFAAVAATGLLVVNRVQHLYRELTKQATTDALTGVGNRRYFLDLIAYEATRSDRYGQPFSLAIVDIDHFKKVNDSYGHLVGDAVLKHFCAMCQAGLRQSDVMGRLGGEEFGILMPNTELHDAVAVLDRMRHALAESPLQQVDAEIVVTGSFGAVSSTAGHGQTDVEALLKAADLAMYTAKSQGRNRVVSNAIAQAAGASPVQHRSEV